MRDQFLVELTPEALAHVTDARRLNELFAAWVETVYHARVHSETHQAPLERFLAPRPPALPDPARLHEAFLWAENRTVTKTATVSLHGNLYEVDAALVGRRVERREQPQPGGEDASVAPDRNRRSQRSPRC